LSLGPRYRILSYLDTATTYSIAALDASASAITGNPELSQLPL
jgi:hypothetical protein